MTAERIRPIENSTRVCPFLVMASDDDPYICAAQGDEGAAVTNVYAGSFCLKMRHVTCQYFIRGDKSVKRSAALGRTTPTDQSNPDDSAASHAPDKGYDSLKVRPPRQQSKPAEPVPTGSKQVRPQSHTPAVAIARPANHDRVTGSALSIIGTAAPQSTVILFDRSTRLAETKADDDGRWTIEVEEIIPGRHRFTAQASRTDGGVAQDSVQCIVEARTAPVASESTREAKEPQLAESVSNQDDSPALLPQTEAPEPVSERETARQEQIEPKPVTREHNNEKLQSHSRGDFARRTRGIPILSAGIGIVAILIAVLVFIFHGGSTGAHQAATRSLAPIPSRQLFTPAAVHAVQVSATQVAFSWRSVPGATRYTVDIGGQQYLVRLPRLSVVHAFRPRTRYTWSVRALGGAGRSGVARSGSIEIRPEPALVWTFAPVNVSALYGLVAIYNPGSSRIVAHVRVTRGTAANLNLASIPPRSSVEVYLQSDPHHPSQLRFGATISASSPMIPQRIVVSRDSTQTEYGLPIVK